MKKRKLHSVVGILFFGLIACGEKKSTQTTHLIKPEELTKLLPVGKSEKLLIFYVGPQLLYENGHIPGAKYIGPASQPAYLVKLRKEAENLSRDKEIVLYCGCCPWEDCPNVQPAFKAMQEMGFTKVKLLELPNNFNQDWIEKGFPVEQGKEGGLRKMPKEVVVSDATFETEVLKTDLPVLVDFWAEWCAPCRMVAPIVSELANDYDGKLKVAKLNVDENPRTSNRYGIRAIPTLLIFKKGVIVDQIVGVQPKKFFQEKIDKLVNADVRE